jgi:hypothetical protein
LQQSWQRLEKDEIMLRQENIDSSIYTRHG